MPRTMPSTEPADLDPSVHVTAAEMLDGFMSQLDETVCPSIDAPEIMSALRHELERLGAENPSVLAEFALGKLLALQTFLLLRMQRAVDKEVEQFDKQRPNCNDIPESVAMTWLPHLSRLQVDLRENAKALGQVRHTLALARRGPLGGAPSSRVIQLSEQRQGNDRRAAGDE